MKKAIAFFLLSIMTLTALQPTVALHFCGDNLRSVAIGKIQKTCCETSIKNTTKTSPVHPENKIHLPVNTCCSTYMIELSTDNFQTPVQQSIVDFQQPAFNPALFPIDIPLKETDSTSSSFLRRFPPGGLARYCVDRLTMICIFRI